MGEPGPYVLNSTLELLALDLSLAPGTMTSPFGGVGMLTT